MWLYFSIKSFGIICVFHKNPKLSNSWKIAVIKGGYLIELEWKQSCFLRIMNKRYLSCFWRQIWTQIIKIPPESCSLAPKTLKKFVFWYSGNKLKFSDRRRQPSWIMIPDVKSALVSEQHLGAFLCLGDHWLNSGFSHGDINLCTGPHSNSRTNTLVIDDYIFQVKVLV